MQTAKSFDVLARFLEYAKAEPTFSPAHISLFVAIYNESQLQQSSVIKNFSKDLMTKSKIAGLATYYRILKDLQHLGFIKYEASYNPSQGSLINILKCEV
jgi:hypothetical protein